MLSRARTPIRTCHQTGINMPITIVMVSLSISMVSRPRCSISSLRCNNSNSHTHRCNNNRCCSSNNDHSNHNSNSNGLSRVLRTLPLDKAIAVSGTQVTAVAARTRRNASFNSVVFSPYQCLSNSLYLSLSLPSLFLICCHQTFLLCQLMKIIKKKILARFGKLAWLMFSSADMC